jgi:predicted DCC family thiol-disulfide oxidoreductase YuxK
MATPTVAVMAAAMVAIDRGGELPVLVFDGVCLLCSASVAFVLRHDRRGRIRFAAMQSSAGRKLLEAHGLDADDPLSFLFVAEGKGHTQSDAILRLVGSFGGAWRLVGVLRVLPRVLRDALYRLIANNRYRWFGRRDTCLMPDAAVRERFLD